MPGEIPYEFNMARYFLEDRLREGFGEKVALRCPDRDWTYREVSALSDRLGNVLRDLGVEQEDRVYICLPDGVEFVLSFFAVLKIGAVVTMGNPHLPPDDYDYYLGYTRAKAAVIPQELAETFASMREKHPQLRNLLVVGAGAGSFWARVERAPERLEWARTTKDDFAVWLFSGGTTGRSKGVVHCHHDFPWNTERYAKQVLEMSERDVTLSVPKLYFGYATGTNLMFPFAVGATAVLFPERPKPEVIFEKIARYRPTVLTNVPTTINQMTQHPDAARQDLSSLRICLSAGEALPEALYVRWKQLFGVEILDGIGSAEMFHIYISNRIGDVRPGSLGKVVPGYEAQVRDEDGRVLGPGEIGRLWVRGDSAGLMYWGDHEKSKQTFFGGDWVRTGDLFRFDEDGYFYYCGRADDLLKVGGIFVAPLELEDCILRHPAVAECAVVRGTDDAGLEIPVAFVVLKKGASVTEEEIQEFVKSRLARFKYPRRVRFVDSLPRTDRGKVDKKALAP
jgi:benzoate-CoA ligase family protein